MRLEFVHFIAFILIQLVVRAKSVNTDPNKWKCVVRVVVLLSAKKKKTNLVLIEVSIDFTVCSNENTAILKVLAVEEETIWSYLIIYNAINLFLLTHQSVFLIWLIYFPRHLPREKTNPSLARLKSPLWMRLRPSCRQQQRRWGCHPGLQITAL